jgi:hypothetical protein
MIAFLRHLIGWIIIIFRSRQDLILENRLGMDGAYFRVHHVAQQLASPFGLLAAVGARTRKIEIGTAVIDGRWGCGSNLWRATAAGNQPRSPEQVIDGWRYFGYRPLPRSNSRNSSASRRPTSASSSPLASG